MTQPFPPDEQIDVSLDDPETPDSDFENPEDHIGEELLDPWADAEALDWPNNEDDEEND